MQTYKLVSLGKGNRPARLEDRASRAALIGGQQEVGNEAGRSEGRGKGGNSNKTGTTADIDKK